jgi:SAM-dependent methyltransferase
MTTMTTETTTTPKDKQQSDARLHKRRQRARKQEQKQHALEDMLRRIDISSVENSFRPIPLIPSSLSSSNNDNDDDDDDDDGNFNNNIWSSVPDCCNPHVATLNGKKGGMDQQGRHVRKLNAKLKNGEISGQDFDKLWGKHGRTTTTMTTTEAPPDEGHNENKSSSSSSVSLLLSSQRGQRKAWQVENFVTLLRDRLAITDPPTTSTSTSTSPAITSTSTTTTTTTTTTVVDFGCGSGNLCLAMAAIFPHVEFVLVDKKGYSLELAQQRAEEAGLTNVRIVQYEFSPSNLESFGAVVNYFDIGIGLHCCGSFTDMVMEICLQRRADCIVCPCCNGGIVAIDGIALRRREEKEEETEKTEKEEKRSTYYEYPRSLFLRRCMSQDEYLHQLSRSADHNHQGGNYAAKCLVEYDRAEWAKEHGFREVELWKMTPVECTPKHHLLYLRH